MIELICSDCGKKLRVKDEAAGMKGKCPQCGAIVRVPDITLSDAGTVSNSTIEPVQHRQAPPAPTHPPIFQQPPLESGHVPYAPSINVHTPRRSSSLGIVSLILGILAISICWIPLLGVLAIPISAVGIILAIIGIVIAFNRQGSGIGWPIGGGSLSLLALIVAFLQIAVIGGASEAIREAAKQENRVNQQEITPSTFSPVPVIPVPPKNNSKLPSPSNNNVPNKPAPQEKNEKSDEWAAADRGVRQGDIEVRVTKVIKGKVPLVDKYDKGKGTSKDVLLAVHILLTNRSRSKKIEYSTWAGADFSFGRDYANLEDNFDNFYKRIGFGFGTSVVGSVSSDSIYPGKTLSDVLVFELPVDTVEYLNLELPAKNFGGEGMLKLRIPARMIKRR